jgi:heme exporter protein A
MQACHIDAQDLSCRRGERILFKGLTFRLDGGQALQVAGSNGIGKSSLIRILAGLLRPFSGKAETAGGIGLVDERPALDPHLPLGKALEFWAGLDGAEDKRFNAMVAKVGLSDLLDVPVRFLSTGQRKRAALARLLIQSPEIWLLDEPLNGLDVHAVTLVESLIADHCAAGGLALVASHQLIALPGAGQINLVDYAA